MRRKPSAADGHSESPAELIARISAEHGSPTVIPGRRRRAGAVSTRDVTATTVDSRTVDSRADHTGALVTTDPLPTRSLTRRLAPLAVGAAAMLVATTIAALVGPTEEATLAAPELSTAILDTEPTTVPPVSPSPVPAPDPTTRAQAAPKPAPPKPRKPAAPRLPAPVASAGDGVQAAVAKGWSLLGGDEFNGAKSSKWGVYEGSGHAGNGSRTADAIRTANGALVIRGDSNGNTGGMAWGDDQRFGKWEMRARFPKGDRQYHPVLLLWPEGAWPEGGEVDFAETTSSSPDVSFFLHYSSSNQQKYAKKALDITQWHNYAVEWVDGRITGYIDGEKWFESTDRSTMPPGKMHATIQLDYFPSGGSPQPTEMYVDYMRIYK